MSVGKHIVTMAYVNFLLTLILAACVFLTSCGEFKGPPGERGPQGPVGEKGDSGQNGIDGSDGIGCHITSVDPGSVAPYGGAIIQCADSSVLILNGSPGADGEDAPVLPPSAYTIQSILNPCGDAPNLHDEVFLKFYGGDLLWLLADNAYGKNPRLSLGAVGNYVTTDGDNCYFRLNADGSISNESHHY